MYTKQRTFLCPALWAKKRKKLNSSEQSRKRRAGASKSFGEAEIHGEVDALATLSTPVTSADRIVLEIRKFIASSIFFNAQAAEKAGLGLTDMQMLHMLQLYGPTTPSRLAAGTGLSSGGVTVALDRLEKAGFIRREANPTDRRSLLIHLVPARLLHIAAIYKGVEAATRRQLATLSSRDLEAVIRFFEALASIRGHKDRVAIHQSR
jgi:MarR family transcriptional regulator, organic hydroperoxide resistance regulator